MNGFTVFGIFLLIRISSIFVVDTWYVPDEYWQSLEVAHNLVFGYGYLTWEWQMGIRSYMYPLCISAVYWILKLIGLDYAELLVFLPRLLQALLSAYADLCFWNWCGKTKWSILTIGSSWYLYYTGSRNLMNTTETSLTTIVLSLFPFQKSKGKSKENNVFLWIIALMCLVRPTAAVILTPLCIYHLITSSRSIGNNVVKNYIPIGLISLLISTSIDSFCHGSFILTWWEFLKFNVINSLSGFYGTHPWHWFLTNGLPVILGIQIVPFLMATFHILSHRKMFKDEFWLLGTIVLSIFMYSLLDHKEFRFIQALIPIALFITTQYLSTWTRKAERSTVSVLVGFILIANAIPAIFVGHFYLKAPIDIMPHLRKIARDNPSNTSLLFLTPCHSTPWYSHLHVNVSARFLLCNPNLDNISNYETEVDYFYKSPEIWFENNYSSNETLPSHIIAYDVLIPRISNILSRYKEILRIFNTFIDPGFDERVGKYLTVYEVN